MAEDAPRRRYDFGSATRDRLFRVFQGDNILLQNDCVRSQICRRNTNVIFVEVGDHVEIEELTSGSRESKTFYAILVEESLPITLLM